MTAAHDKGGGKCNPSGAGEDEVLGSSSHHFTTSTLGQQTGLEMSQGTAPDSPSRLCTVGTSRAHDLQHQEVEKADKGENGKDADILIEVERFLNSFAFDGQIKPNNTMEIVRTLAAASLEDDQVEPARLEKMMQQLSALLKIPRACTTPNEDLNDQERLQRDDFQSHSPPLLALALQIANLLCTSKSIEDIAQPADWVLSFGKFAGEEECEWFSSPPSVRLATETCHRLLSSSSRLPILTHILAKSFPPLFKPHPKLNPATGRLLSRPRGGERHMTDWYEESEDVTGWRAEAGLHNVVRVVVRGLKAEEVEQVWHLLLPPVLAYLDDYDAKNKLLGLTVLDSLLEKVDRSLLTRTGVGQVFQQSLNSAFSALSTDQTPLLLSRSLPRALKLLNILAPPLPTPLPPSPPKSYFTQSEARFTTLCELFTNAVITPWEFKSGEVAIELSILTYLCAEDGLLRNMAKPGTVRYLGILVPHLTSLLNVVRTTLDGKTVGLKVLASRTLGLVLDLVGTKLIKRWRTLLMMEVAKCWVGLEDMGIKGEEVEVLGGELKALVVRLREDAPEGDSDYATKLVELDPIFSPLVSV